MVIYTQCILKPRELIDGKRISVMSRHTLNDGITPDERITADSYDEHRQDLAPPAVLVGAHYKRGMSFTEFEKKYLEFLRLSRTEEVKTLADRALEENITLLCIEDNSLFCHRRLLAEECQRYISQIEVVHL